MPDNPDRPDNYLGAYSPVWSNRDNVLDKDIEERLKQGNSYASHSANDYNGLIWFDLRTEMWQEEIWIDGKPVEIITGNSAANVIAKTLAKYGVK